MHDVGGGDEDQAEIPASMGPLLLYEHTTTSVNEKQVR